MCCVNSPPAQAGGKSVVLAGCRQPGSVRFTVPATELSMQRKPEGATFAPYIGGCKTQSVRTSTNRALLTALSSFN
jgi:hypothetical protein